MAELDAFENRLRTALIRETAGAPTNFDALGFARIVAAREPRRGGFGIWRPVFGVALPRVAWLLIVLAAAITLIAGGLTVGSSVLRRMAVEPRPTVVGFACPAGATPDQPGPVDQARPPIVYAAPMAFDRAAGRIVVLVERVAATSVETWTFDVCTNAWTQMHPSRAPIGPMQLAYETVADRTVTIAGGRAWVYDLHADTWTAGAPLPPMVRRQPRLVDDPIAGVVLAQISSSEDEALPSELWSYDVRADAWTRVLQVDPPDIRLVHEGLLAYDGWVDELVDVGRPSTVGSDGATWLFGIRTSTWRQGPAAPRLNVGYGASGGEIAYDEAIRRTIAYSDGLALAYDARAAAWNTLLEPSGEGLPMSTTARMGHWMVYDPLNDRLVIYGGTHRVVDPTAEVGVQFVQADDVLALDPRTGRWTLLLPARTTQAPPP